MLINFFLFPEKTSGTIVNDTKKLACVLGEIINDIFLTISFGLYDIFIIRKHFN